jgi:GWxTD domain-containing protein
MSRKAWISFVFICLFLAAISSPSCSLFRSMKDDPYFETFYEKTSIIMTDEEKTEYKNLPDAESKKIFIEELWRIRDPDPGTEENENQYLFEERIEYANRWFGWRRPHPGRVPDSSWDQYYGWNTERGRVYLVMGEPDVLYFDIWPVYEGRTVSQPNGESSEAWIYYRYQLTVYFSKRSTGGWGLTSQNSKLFQSLEKAKLELIHPEHRRFIEEPLDSDAKYEDGTIRIVIPISGVNWDEQEDRLVAEFGVAIDVFYEDQKIDEIHEKRTWRKTEKELFETYELVIEIPYAPDQEGEYRLEITIEDLMSFTLSQYKTVVRFSK